MRNKTKIKIIALIAVVIALIIIFSNQSTKTDLENNSAITTPLATISYSCDAGKSIKATFYKGLSKPAIAPDQPSIPGGTATVVLSDGRTMSLAQTISADGSRYANPDESFVFWAKDNGALVLENNQEKSYIGCVMVADVAAGSPLTEIYSNSSGEFSVRVPQNFTVEESYMHQIAPGRVIGGVRFTIPESMTTGTNLSRDSFVSVETIPNASTCSASLFLDGTHKSVLQAEANRTYSVVSSSNAGAGNRYEETVFALPNTNPCIAVRYQIHYHPVEFYDTNTVKEFDKQALITQFDEIRKTLVINQ